MAAGDRVALLALEREVDALVRLSGGHARACQGALERSPLLDPVLVDLAVASWCLSARAELVLRAVRGQLEGGVVDAGA